MDKIYRFIPVVFFIAFLSTPVYSQTCQQVFYDGFESGTLGPAWQIGTGTYTRNITTTAPAVGSYAFEQTGSSSFYEGTYSLFTPSQPSYISWWAKTNTTSAANGYFVAGDGNIASDNGIVFCYFNSSSELRFFNGAGFNTPISANTWYHIELKNINYTARNMDIYINGALVYTGWGFSSGTATDFDRVHLFNVSNGTATYDDILFGTQGPVIDSALINNLNCAGDNNGQVELFVSLNPENGPVTFSWNIGDTTQNISNLGGGQYSVLITDSSGCVATDTFMIYEPLPLSVGSTISEPLCYGDTMGSLDIDYRWKPILYHYMEHI